MSKPWALVKAFEGKTFEQNSKETNGSIPTKMEAAVIDQKTLDDAWKSASKIMGAESEKILVEAAKRIDAYVILPSEKPVIEVVVPVEQKKQLGEKNVTNIRRKNPSKDRSNQKPEKKPRQRKRRVQK